MSGSLQLVLSLIVGAAIGVLSYGFRTPRQAALGGALGVLGTGAISATLGFCMYAADAESTEGVLGIALGAGVRLDVRCRNPGGPEPPRRR